MIRRGAFFRRSTSNPFIRWLYAVSSTTQNPDRLKVVNFRAVQKRLGGIE